MLTVKNDTLLCDFPYFFMPFYTTLQRGWELVLKSIVSYVFRIQNQEIHATKGQPICPSSFIDVTYRLTLRTVKRIAHPHFTNKIRKFRRLKVDKFAPPCWFDVVRHLPLHAVKGIAHPRLLNEPRGRWRGWKSIGSEYFAFVPPTLLLEGAPYALTFCESKYGDALQSVGRDVKN